MSIGPAYIYMSDVQAGGYFFSSPYVCTQQYVPVIKKAETIQLSQVSCLSPRFFRYCDLLSAFKDNGGTINDVREMNAFDSVAQKVSDLPFESAFVECSKPLDLVEISLSFGKGIDISVGKKISSDNEDVLFSLFVDHQLLVVDKKDINELKESLQKTVGS